MTDASPPPLVGESPDSNAATLAVYEARADTYREQTARLGSVGLQRFLTGLASMAPDGEILEIGSAHGRDALFLESLGRSVRRTDATRAFVEMMRDDGHQADVLNVLTDDLTDADRGPYAGVLADAVLLHFTPAELELVLTKARDALVPDGLLAFTVKVGDRGATYAEWSDHKLGLPRFFQYWQADSLREVVTAAGFAQVQIDVDTGGLWDWLLVTARR